jgi:hypothetical protein
MKPLDGAKLKIVRAQKHLDCLNREIGAYLDTKPYKVPVSRRGQLIRIGSPFITSDPPPDLGCIFGDCLNNLMSSLDYIAWELGTKHTPIAVLTGRHGSSLHFPLHKNAGDFSTNGRPKLENRFSFPTSVVDVIESVQPYQAGYESLGLLSKLVKSDKHRLPLLTVATPDANSINCTVSGITLTLVSTGTPPADGVIAPVIDPNSPEVQRMAALIQEIQRNAALPGTTEVEDPPDVKMDYEVEVFVSLKDFPVPREPVDVTLTNIFKCVSDIVPRFEPFFI